MRRRLLAAGAVGAIGAGCLDGPTDEDTESNDEVESDDAETPDEGTNPALERWLPASASELAFRYTDLDAVRSVEDEFDRSTREAIPRRPSGSAAELVDELAGENANLAFFLEFGRGVPRGTCVVGGSFDPDRLDGDVRDERDGFSIYDLDDVRAAVSADRLVVGEFEGLAPEDVVVAGVDGTDRLSAADERFAALLEYATGGALAWGVAGMPRAGEAEYAVQSWEFGAETTTMTAADVREDEESAAAIAAEVDLEEVEDDVDDASVETDGDAALITGTVPTSEYEYVDLFDDRSRAVGREPQAAVEIDVDTTAGDVVVIVVSMGNADAVEIHDGDGKRGEAEVGEWVTLEYDEGESDTVRAVAVRDDRTAVVATRDVEF